MKKITEQMLKEREPVHPKCQGIGFTDEDKQYVIGKYCSKIEPIETAGSKNYMDTACRCTAYVNPSSWWRKGGCPLADHFKLNINTGNVTKIRAGQQKQKKRR